MRPGKYEKRGGDIGAYVCGYNQIKYLRPVMPIEQFVMYVTRYLLLNCQIAMTLNKVKNLEDLQVAVERLHASEVQSSKEHHDEPDRRSNNYRGIIS